MHPVVTSGPDGARRAARRVIRESISMSIKRGLLATIAALALTTTAASAQQTLRYAFQGNLNTLDPHSLNETTTLGLQGNVYEGLTSATRI